MKKAIKRHIPFGLHVMLDIYDCSPEVLNDPGLVTNILQTLPEQ